MKRIVIATAVGSALVALVMSAPFMALIAVHFLFAAAAVLTGAARGGRA